MAQTAQREEQRWLTARWLSEQKRPAQDAGGTGRRSDQSGIDHASRPGDGRNENICSPTLEKLYAAKRKQKEDLKRQIEDAMAQNLE